MSENQQGNAAATQGGGAAKPFNLAKSNFGLRGWLVIIIAGLSVLLQSSLINDSLNITVGAFSQAYGWDQSILYIFSTVAAWIAVLGTMLWGFLSVKKSPKFVWIASLILVAITCFVWGRVQSLGMYFAMLALASIAGQGFNYIGNYNVVSNWFPRKKGLAMGWVTIGFPLSASITTGLAGGLLGAGGISGIYTFYAALAVVILVLVVAFITSHPEEAGQFPDNDRSFTKEQAAAEHAAGLEYMKTSEWTVKKLLRTKQVWQVGLSFSVLGLLSIGVMSNFFPRAMQGGYQPGEIVIMLAITGIIACFGSYACGVLDAKVGPKKATFYTLLLAVVALTLNIIPSRITMYLSLPCIGVMLGGAANYLVSITNTIWGRYDFPNAYRVIMVIHSFVAATGVAIVGVLGQQLNYASAYVVVAGLAAIAAIFVYTLDDAKLGR